MTNLLSRWVGWLAGIRFPRWLLVPVLRLFVRRYRVDLSEIGGSLADYESLDRFFTRSLRPETRPVDRTEGTVVSPVDGKIQNYGTIREGELIQAKGISYRLDQLIPGPNSRLFEGGDYMTFLLAPGDCHLVFSPVDGVVRGAVYVPGRLFPVRSPERIPALYTRNERLMTYIETSWGMAGVVMVGAFNVGRMTAAYDPEIQTNRNRKSRSFWEKSYDPGVRVARGEKIGLFHLGSTVILLFPKETIRWRDGLEGNKVRYGEPSGFRRRSESGEPARSGSEDA